MSAFPGSPKLVKGAIVGIDPFNPLASVAIFQYNPDTLTRTLSPSGGGGEHSDRVEAMRLKGAPIETIKLDAELDATDKLEVDDGKATAMGIYPQLSALEMLMYPKSLLVAANTVLLLAGTMEIIPPMGPFTVFIWGVKRVLPVRLTDLSITEEAHDTNLNPIRARVSIGMRVLNYNDLPLIHPGYHLFLAHQVIKETMATIGSVNNLASIDGVKLNFF